MCTVARRGEQFLVLAGNEPGETGRRLQEDAGPGRYGVGGAAVGVAGAVVEGERGRGGVVVAGAGGGELLEGGTGEQRGGDGRGQARMCGRCVEAVGDSLGGVCGERHGRWAVPPDDRGRGARVGAGAGAVVGDEAFQCGQGEPRTGRPGGLVCEWGFGDWCAVVVAAGCVEVGGEGVVGRLQGLVQGGGKVGAVADQGQVDPGEGTQLQEAHYAAGGEAVGAQNGQPGDGQGGHPGGSGFPGGLTPGGKAAGEQGRFAQGGEKVVGEARLAGGARAGVQSDPSGRQVVGGQGGVGVDDVVMAVDDHDEGRRPRGGRRGGVVVSQGG